DHPDLAASIESVSNCLLMMHSPAAALPLCQTALEMRRRIYAGQDHPDIAGNMLSLAFTLNYTGQYDAALEMFRDAAAMAERIKSPLLFQYYSALGAMN